MPTSALPVAVIGAGPVGLAAAAHLLRRGLSPLVLERGPTAAATVAEWAHVRLFSPFAYNIDAAARALLEQTGWRAPDPEHLPTGAELIAHYLVPLAAHPAIAPRLRLNAEVVAITRKDHNKLLSEGRNTAPFLLHWRDASGTRHRLEARAVVDASGTWTRPNPIGLDGLPVEGEPENAALIDYAIPDVLGPRRADFADRHTLVIGAGHSAINVALDLLVLKESAPETRITWATRAGGLARLAGGGLADQLPGRGDLGLRAAAAIRSGEITLRSPFAVDRIAAEGERLRVIGQEGGQAAVVTVDRIVVATGFRPDLTLLSELRLSLDPTVETTPALAPLIDPNLHSCGTVRPHGVTELAHPERDLYIVGMKSYGRAPTFLMATGYEQVRSIAAELAGDPVAAREVHLNLPETGVCKTAPPANGEGQSPPPTTQASCCATPPPALPDARRSIEEQARASDERDCAPRTQAPAPAQASCCGGPPASKAEACCTTVERAFPLGESDDGSSTPASARTPDARAQSSSCGVPPASTADTCCTADEPARAADEGVSGRVTQTSARATGAPTQSSSSGGPAEAKTDACCTADEPARAADEGVSGRVTQASARATGAPTQSASSGDPAKAKSDACCTADEPVSARNAGGSGCRITQASARAAGAPTQSSSSGGPAEAKTDVCCAADEQAPASDKGGSGRGTQAPARAAGAPTQSASSDGPAEVKTDACCATDEQARAADGGGSGRSIQEPAPAPETPAQSSCCGGPPEVNADACCRADEEARALGESGCGCSNRAGGPDADVSKRHPEARAAEEGASTSVTPERLTA